MFNWKYKRDNGEYGSWKKESGAKKVKELTESAYNLAGKIALNTPGYSDALLKTRVTELKEILAKLNKEVNNEIAK